MVWGLGFVASFPTLNQGDVSLGWRRGGTIRASKPFSNPKGPRTQIIGF